MLTTEVKNPFSQVTVKLAVKYLCLLRFLALLAVGTAAEDFDYCTIPCKDGNGNPIIHTCCTFKTDTPGGKCKGYKDRLLTPRQKQEVLDKHNDLRGQLARGVVPGQPAARNMQALVWSLELEQVARRWALQCDYNHDECRSTRDGKVGGQNLAYEVHSGRKDFQLGMTQKWFDEHKLYTSTGDNEFTAATATGHYTQVAWAKTQYLGCERTMFTYNYPGTEYLVCNYSPAGNMRRQPVYLTTSDGGAGQLLPGAEPRPGESGKPEETVLRGAPSKPYPPPAIPPKNPPLWTPPPGMPRLPPPATAPPVPALLPPGITMPPQYPPLPPPTKRPPPPRWYPPAQRYQPKRRNRNRWMPPWKPIFPFYPKPIRYPGRPGINCEDVPEIPVQTGWGSVQAGYPAKPIECQGTVAPGIRSKPGVVIIAGDD